MPRTPGPPPGVRDTPPSGRPLSIGRLLRRHVTWCLGDVALRTPSFCGAGVGSAALPRVLAVLGGRRRTSRLVGFFVALHALLLRRGVSPAPESWAALRADRRRPCRPRPAGRVPVARQAVTVPGVSRGSGSPATWRRALRPCSGRVLGDALVCPWLSAALRGSGHTCAGRGTPPGTRGCRTAPSNAKGGGPCQGSSGPVIPEQGGAQGQGARPRRTRYAAAPAATSPAPPGRSTGGCCGWDPWPAPISGTTRGGAPEVPRGAAGRKRRSRLPWRTSRSAPLSASSGAGSPPAPASRGRRAVGVTSAANGGHPSGSRLSSGDTGYPQATGFPRGRSRRVPWPTSQAR